MGGPAETQPVEHRTPPSAAPFGEGLECHYGSRLVVLSRRAVDVIDSAVREHPELVLYYRDTLSPVESYVHTVLANDRSALAGRRGPPPGALSSAR